MGDERMRGAHQPAEGAPAVGKARGEDAHEDLDEDDSAHGGRPLPERDRHERRRGYLCQQHLRSASPEEDLAARPALKNPSASS
jgi:hypothetical protein